MSRHKPDKVIDTSKYVVIPIDSDKVAKEFITEHHYSGSYPAARIRVGLWKLDGPELVGVAVFGVPAHPLTFARYVDGADQHEGVELNRLVILDEVASNAETWFLAQCFRVVEQRLPDVRFILSFSDPIPRERPDGSVFMPGHLGTIYQAHNGIYVGKSTSKITYIGPQGQTFYRRTLNKLRNGERGRFYVERQLVDIGAPLREPGEEAADWIDRVIDLGLLRKQSHPGNHAYVWALGNKRQKKQTTRRFKANLPYPKGEL
tara:strand:- start:2936 stop:3718 length:783 start_codon:yes stop_codon:yes gene_type:complete